MSRAIWYWFRFTGVQYIGNPERFFVVCGRPTFDLENRRRTRTGYVSTICIVGSLKDNLSLHAFVHGEQGFLLVGRLYIPFALKKYRFPFQRGSLTANRL